MRFLLRGSRVVIQGLRQDGGRCNLNRLAVKELNLSYSIGGTVLINCCIYIYIPIMVTSVKFLNSNPVKYSRVFLALLVMRLNLHC